VGSVGRYADFTRDFLPRKSISRQRWAAVKSKTFGHIGLDPIEEYQIGEVFFVLDGNHRVSVARQQRSESIQAYVREVKTEVHLSPDDQPDDIILKAEYSEFLAATHIKSIIPDSEIRVTEPGRYLSILQQINAVQFSKELETFTEVPYPIAIKIWFKELYLPIIEIIQNQNLMEEFPDRTETDLYLWIIKYRTELGKTAGWQVQTGTAAAELANTFGRKKNRGLRYRVTNFLDRILPESLKPPAKAGIWRKRRLAALEGRMFADILVVADTEDQICDTLEHALQIAWLEGSNVHGLLYSTHKIFQSNDQEKIRTNFTEQCEAVKISGQINFEVGKSGTILKKRIDLVDLVTLPVSILFPDKSHTSITSEFHRLLRRSIAPILITQGTPQSPERVLLAYDESPKSEQGLYLGAFMTTFWEVSLEIIVVTNKNLDTSLALDKAKSFLDHYGVKAGFFQKTGAISDSILTHINESEINLLIMGGYDSWNSKDTGSRKLLDKILLSCKIPVLICN